MAKAIVPKRLPSQAEIQQLLHYCPASGMLRWRVRRGHCRAGCWERSHKAWNAYVYADGVQHRLGRFKSLSKATSVVEAARRQLHGEFARVS